MNDWKYTAYGIIIELQIYTSVLWYGTETLDSPISNLNNLVSDSHIGA